MKMAWRTAVCAALLLSGASWGPAAAEDGGLFSADASTAVLRRPARSLPAEDAHPEAGPSSSAFSEFSDSAELRSRAVRMDLGRLSAARLDIEQGRTVRLNLNLFANAEFDAVMERAEPTASGYSLAGRLAADPLSTVVLTVGDGLVLGTVWGRDGRYEIRSAGGAVKIRQLDPSGLPRCALGTAPLGGSPVASVSEHHHHAATGSSGGSRPAVGHRRPLTSIPRPTAPVIPRPQPLRADDGDVIDLLVVYPEFEARRVGNHRNMRALIEHAVALTNEAYRAGGVVHRVALVAAVPVEYGARIQRISLEDLAALVDPSDGAMDEVHQLRDSFAADIVALYVEGRGATFLLNPPNGVTSSSAFVRFSGKFLAHGLGHLMGLAHSWWDPYLWSASSSQPSKGVYPYSMGHFLDQRTLMGTIMAGYGLNRFSNPRQKYPDEESGVPLGVPGDEWPEDPDARVGPADAVRSMNETRRMVANFRASAARCEYSLAADAGSMPATGGEFKVRIETAPGCFWNAWAEDGFISLVGASSGTGSGEATYLVGTNNHWPREGAIAVAGKVHAVKQLGSRPMTPVGERSPKIQRMLLFHFKHGTAANPYGRGSGPPYDPAELTADDLATIPALEVGERWELDSLRPGDLDGLSSLVNLHIESSSLVLHPGAFDGLSSLVNLHIGAPSLDLHSGMFDDLSNLASLHISSPSLVLRPGVFDGLSNLASVSLSAPSLVLHPGAFDGLSNLLELAIWSSPQILRPGMFNGLSNLQSLILSLGSGVCTDTPVRVPPSVFEGLSSLYSLAFGVGACPLEMRKAMFTGLSKLSVLRMQGHRHTELRRNMFEGLTNLKVLHLGEGYLENIELGAFEDLSNLRILRLDRNELVTLRPGWANGLSSLEELNLSQNYFTEIPPLQDLDKLKIFVFSENLVSDIEPLLVHKWLEARDLVNVVSNPLSQQSLQSHIPALKRRGVQVYADPQFSVHSTIVEEGRNANFHVSLLPRAPVDLTVPWVLFPGSAAAGEDYASIPDRGELLFRAGETHGVISIPTNEDNLAELDENFAVRLEEPNAPPGFGRRGVPLLTPHRYWGIAVIRDDDLKMPFGESIAIDLASAFHYPVEGPLVYVPLASAVKGPRHWSSNGLAYNPVTDNPLTYKVKYGNPNVASAAVRNGVAVISSNGPGTTTVTVTATDSQGQTATRTFVVTVKPPPKKSYWGGWRSVLLQSSSDEADEP